MKEEYTLLEKFDDESIKRTKREQRLFNMLEDMRGRKGVFNLYDYDEDIQEEMLNTWYEILFC